MCIRDRLMTYLNKCTGCGACVHACPNGAVTIENGLSATDREKCTACGACVQVCPAECREIAGKMTTVGEAIEQVVKDKLFLDSSGGGMTISGGEALAHPEFTENLLIAAHEEGIKTAVETCSFASREVIDRVFPHVDTALLDIKHMDSEEHRRLTGAVSYTHLDVYKRQAYDYIGGIATEGFATERVFDWYFK